MCVFLRSMCLKFLLRDDFESLICWLDHWLSCILDCIHVLNTYSCWLDHWLSCMFSIPCCLSSFFSFFLSYYQQLLNTWWIDQESSCLLDSFSTPDGSIEFLFLYLMDCSSTRPRYLYLLMTVSLPASIELYWGSIYSFLHDLILISSISLDLSAHVHLLNTISLAPNLFLFDFSSFFKIFFSW